MGRSILHFIIYGNYFVGLLAVVLSVETCLQLRISLPDFLYFIALFCGTTFYYTYAYSSNTTVKQGNTRSIWFRKNYNLVMWSQRILLFLGFGSGITFAILNLKGISALALWYWISLLGPGLAALLYYGLHPSSIMRINLRNTGWLKAFVIGFVWAGAVTLLPIVIVKIESGSELIYPFFGLWLFVKNWMFCTVNAIIFDIKDYAADSNQQLQTFVVRFGLRKTIFLILMPLLGIGFVSLVVFTRFMQFPVVPVLFNLLPFPLLLWATWSMQKRHSLIYYLVVIDGVIMVKGLCGIAGSFFI